MARSRTPTPQFVVGQHDKSLLAPTSLLCNISMQLVYKALTIDACLLSQLQRAWTDFHMQCIACGIHGTGLDRALVSAVHLSKFFAHAHIELCKMHCRLCSTTQTWFTWTEKCCPPPVIPRRTGTFCSLIWLALCLPSPLPHTVFVP